MLDDREIASRFLKIGFINILMLQKCRYGEKIVAASHITLLFRIGGENTSKLEDIKPGCSVKGISSLGLVSIINVEWHGDDLVTVTYKDLNGHLDQQIIGRDLEKKLEISKSEIPWTFDADSKLFRLASEAKRIKLAYLFDPLLAVHTSKIRPLPHQITGVYDVMLQRHPLKFAC